MAEDIVDCTIAQEMNHCVQTLLGDDPGDSNKRTDTERISVASDKNAGLFTTDDYKKVMWCKYIGDPVVIKIKCGTYCYARIKCGVSHGRAVDEKFQAGSFCKIAEGKKQCPPPHECYQQPLEDNPNIASVTRVKNHTGTVGTAYKKRKTFRALERAEFERDDDDNLLMAHSTEDQLMAKVAELDKESENTIKSGHKTAQYKQTGTRSPQSAGGSGSGSSIGGFFGGIFNFFKCLFGSKNCKRGK